MSRRLVISDIHGCNKTLNALLQKLQITKEDKLYFLGDYIDRGPDSSGVLDTLIGLKNSGYHIFALMGNHEYQALIAQKEYDKRSFHYFMKKINKSGDLLNKKRKIKKRYRSFLKELPYYIELNDFFLVHAGFDFKKENPFEDISSMLNIRGFKYDKKQAKGKPIIYGHTPTNYHIIQKKIIKRKNKIPLDNGCFYTKKHRYYDFTQLHRLCCLNLDSFELICQNNVEYD